MVIRFLRNSGGRERADWRVHLKTVLLCVGIISGSLAVSAAIPSFLEVGLGRFEARCLGLVFGLIAVSTAFTCGSWFGVGRNASSAGPGGVG